MGNTESVGGRAVVSLSLNELEDRIKRAKITGTLDLNHQGIATFPHEILQLKGKITSLSCNYNSISRIPDGLAASMVTLTRIELQSNWLTTLPPDFGQLTNLEILDLSYNMLSALPDSLGEFRRLKELDVGWNKIQYLPASLLPKIASLKKLNLQGNFLTALPQEIGQLSILTSLNLRNNKLQLLPPEIGKLRQLTDINLIENQLTYLPPEFGELKDLLRLLIFDNKIDTIPVEVAKLPSLANVDMSNNRLDRLFYPPVFDSSAALPATDINTGAAEENGWKKKSRKKDQKSENGGAPSETGSSGGGGSSRKKKKKQPTDDVAASPAKGRRTKGEATTVTSPDGGAGEQKPAADGAAPKESEKEKGKEKTKEKEKAGAEEGEEEGESDEFSRRRQIDLERELDRERERAKQQESQQEEEQDDPVKWKRVQRLHITNNLLTEVPMSIAKAMKGLKVLCLQHNSIRHIPRELGLLKHLETIDLSYNQLEDLPIELAQLPLKILYVTNNRLRYTETLERMCGGLLSLQEIHLGANQLKQIPQSLAKLEFLTYINLYQNFVSVLPDSFEDLPSFCEPRPEIGSSSRQLILSYNRFETFPPQLLKLRCLHELHFSGNAVPEIPDEIKNLSRLMLLSLGNNRIPLKLPESLGELASLERLYLRGTQLANVPTSLRKLIPRLIEIDVSPDTVLPSGTEGADGNAGSDIQKKDKAEAASTEAPGGEASGEKPNKENGNGEAAQPEGGEKATATPAAADDEATPAPAASGSDAAASSNETPESARRGKKNKDKAEADKSENEASSKNEGEPKASAESGAAAPASTAAESGGEDSKKSDRQRRKEKEKEEKKAKKQKNKDEKRSKGGRFLQRFKGGDGEKKGNNGSGGGGKGDGSGEGKGKGGDQGSKKVPKRPRLPKDWPLYITPNEEGTPSKRFAFGCAKMIGLGRKNEDTLMVRSSLTGRDDEDYFAVFDGHGGKHASRFAADNLHIILSEQLALSPSDPEGALRRSFAEVHQRMLTYFQKSNLREECGCTAIVSLIVGNTVYVAGAGDSRAVFCYGNQVQRVSLDHKPYLEEESRRVRAVGGLVKVDSDYAKQYRVCKLFAGGGFGGLAVSRALGDFSWSPQVVEEPTIMTIPLPSKAAASPAPLKSSRDKERKKVVEDDDEDDAKHAYLILACDGVWDVLSDEESAAIAMKERNALTAAVRIREHSYYLGSGDDICAVVVRLL